MRMTREVDGQRGRGKRGKDQSWPHDNSLQRALREGLTREEKTDDGKMVLDLVRGDYGMI